MLRFTQEVELKLVFANAWPIMRLSPHHGSCFRNACQGPQLGHFCCGAEYKCQDLNLLIHLTCVFQADSATACGLANSIQQVRFSIEPVMNRWNLLA